jgi:hypothetical protein
MGLTERSMSIEAETYSLRTRIAGLWVCGLVAFSLQPWRPARHRGAIHDIPHFVAYFTAALLLLHTARGARQRILAPLAVVVVGATLECAQHLLYRGPLNWRDLAIDGAAALFACLVTRLLPSTK